MGRLKRSLRPVPGKRQAESEWLYGRHAVLEALRAGRRRVDQLLLAAGNKPHPLLREAAALAKDRARRLPRAQVDALLPGVNHQGIALQVSPYPYVDLGDWRIAARARSLPRLFLLLDHLQDAQNVGTLLRAAEAVGCAGVILPNRRAAAITPAASNASAGAVEHLAVARVANLGQAAAFLVKQSVWVYALTGKPEATAIYDVALRGDIALIIGNEGKGVSALLRKRSDGLLSLPMWGQVASLNAATAGAIALYEVRRQQGL